MILPPSSPTYLNFLPSKKGISSTPALLLGLGLFNQAINVLTTIGADQREINELIDLSQRLEQFTERDMKAQYSMLRSTNKGRGKRFDPNDPFNH